MSTTHDLIQGTPAWDQFRLTHYGASEAAAMLGLSPNVKRSELLRMKHTGDAKVFSAWVQENILDHGHVVEAMARPVVEQIVGADLYPVVRSAGKISASCDGLTLDETIAWEHKQWNEESAALVRQGIVPEHHMPQCQQVLMITKAEKLIFVVSDGTDENLAFCWVKPDLDWFGRIVAGWHQFEQDLIAYVPEESAPKLAGAAVDALPALIVEVVGHVTSSNFGAFKTAAHNLIASIKTELETDQDFADAENIIKFLNAGEDRIELVIGQILGQAASIGELIDSLKTIKGLMRDKRLALNTNVGSRKSAIRTGIVFDAQTALDEFVTAQNQRLGAAWIARVQGPFAEAIKGKKTVASLKDAAATTLANEKIKVTALADRLLRNRQSLMREGRDWFFLFTDFKEVGARDAEAFDAIAAQRIQKYETDEAARIAAEATNAAAAASRLPAATVVAPAPGPVGGVGTPVAPVRTVPAGEVANLNVGQICGRLGFVMTAAFITDELHVEPGLVDARRVSRWSESGFRAICDALVKHVQKVSAGEVATA